MDRMTEEYTKLKMVLQQTDRIVEEMRKERDVLRAQVQITDYWIYIKYNVDFLVLFKMFILKLLLHAENLYY